jgi:hypothetical protein
MVTKVFGDNTTGVDYTGTDDVYIDLATPTTNKSGDAFLVIQTNNGGSRAESLVRFTGLSNIPAGSTVTAVQLDFYQYDQSGGTYTAELYQCLRNWTEAGATWNTYDGTNSWATAGGTGAGDIGASTLQTVNTTTVIGGTVSFLTSAALVAAVQAWVDGAANNGFFIKRDNMGADDGSYKAWRASEGTDGQRPKLTVTYTAGAAVTGGFTLADMVLSGSFATGALSQLAGGITMDDFALSGFLGLAPGRIDTQPFKNWGGTLLPGVTVPNVVFLKLDRTLPLALVNQVTAGDAVMTIQNAALVTGTYYIMVSYDATGANIGAELVLAT